MNSRNKMHDEICEILNDEEMVLTKKFHGESRKLENALQCFCYTSIAGFFKKSKH